MKRRDLIAILFTVLVGGFVGFNASSPTPAMANELIKVRVVDVPSVDLLKAKPLNNEINIDLQSEKVSFNGNVDNTTVTIRKQDVVVPVKEVKIVEKYIYEPNIAYSTRLLKNLMPLSPPKINVDRN